MQESPRSGSKSTLNFRELVGTVAPELLKWYKGNPSRFAIIWFAVAFGFGLQSLAPSHSCLSGQTAVSLADYERLEQGMTLTDAQAALGRATEVSQNKSTATYEWRNCDQSLISATFDQGRLIGKIHSGLR